MSGYLVHTERQSAPARPESAGPCPHNAPKSQTPKSERKGRCRTNSVLTFIFSDPPNSAGTAPQVPIVLSLKILCQDRRHHPKVVIGSAEAQCKSKSSSKSRERKNAIQQCLVVGLNLVQLGSDQNLGGPPSTRTQIFFHDPCYKTAQASGSIPPML